MTPAAPTLFDLAAETPAADPASSGAAEGERRKQEGMAQAAESKASLLAFARELAVKIAKDRSPYRCVSADDVQEALVQHGISEFALGNAAGSLFLDRKQWRWTGRRVKSRREQAHGNELKVWEWIGDV